MGWDTGHGALESPFPCLRARSSGCAARPQHRWGGAGGQSCTVPLLCPPRSLPAPVLSGRGTVMCLLSTEHRARGMSLLHCHSPPSWLRLPKQLNSQDPSLTSWIPPGPSVLLKPASCFSSLKIGLPVNKLFYIF